MLTGAGIAPLSAWRYAAAEDAPAARSGSWRGWTPPTSCRTGWPRWRVSVRTGERSAWAALAATWWIATEAGAALSATLTRSAEVLRGLAQGAREVEVALAGPTATSRVVLALPARRARARRAARLRRDRGAGHGAWRDLPGGGRHPDRGRRALESAADPCGARPRCDAGLVVRAVRGGARRRRLDRPCAPAGRRGVRRGGARSARRRGGCRARLRADGRGSGGRSCCDPRRTRRRRAARTLAARRAAELETRLLLPLGLCVLPAFVLLGVVPIALAIVSSTVIGGMRLCTDVARHDRGLRAIAARHHGGPRRAGEERSDARPDASRASDDRGAATAEYAITIMAAVGFAGLLVVILRSGEVQAILTGLVRSALSVGG